jgi:hypothetical protein
MALVCAGASQAVLAQDLAREERTYDATLLYRQLANNDFVPLARLRADQDATADLQQPQLSRGLSDASILTTLQALLRDSESKARIEGTELRVLATPDQHARIQAMVDRVAAEQAHPIQVTVAFIEMPIASLSRLDPKWQALVDSTALVEQPAMLDPTDVQALRDSLRGVAGVRIVSAPRITLGQGARAFTQVSTGQAYVSGFEQVGQNPFSPIVKDFESGTSVSLQASSAPDGSFAVAVNAEVVELIEMVEQPWPEDSDRTVQVPRFAATEVSSVLSIEAGASALLRMGSRDDTAVVPEKITLLLVTPTKPAVN